MFLINVLILIVSFLALIKGADLFVDGSAALAKVFRVSGLIIGLTIVALGTSAPELAVSTSAALQGSNEIALSNVIGSNIFNILCVLGLCAVIYPVPVDRQILKRDFPVSIISTIFVLIATSATSIYTGHFNIISMEEDAGSVSRVSGAILLVLFVAYICYLIYDAKNHHEIEDATKNQPVWKCLMLIVTGLALIVGGGQAVVYSAKNIARFMGMTETLIGLTIVAVGTSLPELVTSVVAAKKGETGLAVGNVIGSNIFNLMFILGLSALIHPVTVNLASVYDMAILAVVSILILIFSLTNRTIKRTEGIIMLTIYIIDIAFAVMR